MPHASLIDTCQCITDARGALVQAARTRDATGAWPLDVAGTMGASEETKEVLFNAWFEVAPEADMAVMLVPALKNKWGEAAVARIVSAAPQVGVIRVCVTGGSNGTRHDLNPAE